MYKILCTLLLLAGAAVHAAAETNNIKGHIADTTGKSLGGISVALLNPSDSTMAAFGVSNASGYFEVKGAGAGTYLLQVAGMGFFTQYRKVSLPMQGDGSVGAISLEDNPAALSEVVVSGEKIPVQLKGDTVEYNAGSFNVKPNAVVEDLLRQLPGVEVDKDGNIKSRGKDVKKVLVDGKEFFGDDPKIATKNLPADAISKVQTFDKHSDQSEFTGIDDGQRDQTINLLLKDGKRTGYFGDVTAGGGTDERYEASAKVYQFRKKTQLAALGMLNNINQFGFTMADYINFKGGLGSLMDGNGGISLNNGNLPVDYGQPVTGNVTSGAVGLNYSYEPRKNNRFNISYLGNGADKDLDQQTNSTNLTPGGSFVQDRSAQEDNQDRTHRLSARWRNDIDSFHQLTWNGGAELGTTHNDRHALSQSYSDELLNQLKSDATQKGDVLSVSSGLGYTQRFGGKWPVFRSSASVSYDHSLSRTDWNNLSRFFNTGTTVLDRQFQENRSRQLKGDAGFSFVRSLGNGLYLEPGIRAYYDRDLLERRQGLLPEDGQLFDSLSPDFYRTAYKVVPQLSLKRSTLKTQWNLSLAQESIWIKPVFNEAAGDVAAYRFLLPSLSWQHDLSGGRRVGMHYSASTKLPSAGEMLPVVNSTNPLSRVRGNSSLRPEYEHNLNVNYHHFDQFSMSSLFAYINGSYTQDKINWARTVQPDLSQDLNLVNTAYEAALTGNVSYSKPLRRLGISISASLKEDYRRAVSPVNNVDNTNGTWTHDLELSFSNRKKDKWDVSIGARANIADSRYSLNKELNTIYYNYSGFGEISYRHGEHWFFMVSADLTHYASNSFDEPVTIPLLKAEITRSFLKNDRASLTLKGFDLLDRNTSVQRVSQLNYLLEQRSNTIGRYFMLSFSYRLNKAGGGSGGPVIRVR